MYTAQRYHKLLLPVSVWPYPPIYPSTHPSIYWFASLRLCLVSNCPLLFNTFGSSEAAGSESADLNYILKFFLYVVIIIIFIKFTVKQWLRRFQRRIPRLSVRCKYNATVAFCDRHVGFSCIVDKHNSGKTQTGKDEVFFSQMVCSVHVDTGTESLIYTSFIDSFY